MQTCRMRPLMALCYNLEVARGFLHQSLRNQRFSFDEGSGRKFTMGSRIVANGPWLSHFNGIGDQSGLVEFGRTRVRGAKQDVRGLSKRPNEEFNPQFQVGSIGVRIDDG